MNFLLLNTCPIALDTDYGFVVLRENNYCDFANLTQHKNLANVINVKVIMCTNLNLYDEVGVGLF